ncbi:MAG: hypothetical protein E7327_07600 [Clostridiales bacterium]|nr:hypothetical protein [Clostridiales bacterium]
MNGSMQIHTPKERLRARQEGERRARTCLVQLICIVSILRTALTRLLPLAGNGAWWLTLGCMLPGAAVFAALRLSMRLTKTATIADLVRACLGRSGGWLACAVLAALTFLDGAASITALITLFTEGVGTRGTQLTLALLTGAVLLACLHREGLPRGVFLLRRTMLAAALVTAGFGLPAVRTDSLFPLLAEGEASLSAAFRAGWSITWPLTLLLTIPQEDGKRQVAAVCPVALTVAAVLLFIALTNPHELLARRASLADSLLLPTRYATPALQMLAQCLMMLAFFFAIGGAALLSSELICAPMGHAPDWLPWAGVILLVAGQAIPAHRLWALLGAAEPWLLVPLAALGAVCLPNAIIRRDRT